MEILIIAYAVAMTILAVKSTFEVAFLKEELYDVRIDEVNSQIR